MQRHFEGGVYWNQLAEIYGEMSRAVGFRGVVRFRGIMVLLYSGKFSYVANLCIFCMLPAVYENKTTKICMFKTFMMLKTMCEP